VKEGDYVLATKYSDGDPGDQFAVGWFNGMLPKLGGDRYMVRDASGKDFRRNGFRRCEPITHEQGVWFVEHQKEIEASMRDFYYDDDGNRHGRSVWDWLASASTGDSNA
jgi:hypothetical protein